MCGIVGYAGFREAYDVLLEGLKALEYRGCDSAGIAMINKEQGCLEVAKVAGMASLLEQRTRGKLSRSNLGLGHSRWATHGRPSDKNAHPHVSCCHTIALIHNGIIENYRVLRAALEKEGHRFLSQTDTEVLVHLVEKYYRGDLLEAVREATDRVEGSYAIAVVCSNEPQRIICARKDSPLIIGLGQGENFVASDFAALLPYTRRTYILEDGEFVSLSPESVEVFDRGGNKIVKEIYEVEWDIAAAEKGGYPHFMLKEIMEQPQAVRDTLRRRIDLEAGRVLLPELDLTAEEARRISKIYIIACGTSSHAGYVGKYALERLASLPVEVDPASEFRYRDPLLDQNHLAIVISQSGETADTLEALRLCKEKGIRVLAITNAIGSSAAREADRTLLTFAGPEIAVASTKAYLTQLILLYLLALYLGQLRGTVTREQGAELVRGLNGLPDQLVKILTPECLTELKEIAVALAHWDSIFYIGRNLDYATALEGSLKLKEVSYIHAEAYPAGELKHGPLALITGGMPVVALATQEKVLEKTLSNIQEIRAREGAVFLVASEEFVGIERQADWVFHIPRVHQLLTPVPAILPLQLIAYYTGLARECPVDKPRNLAKSVTVE
ncbi:MAG: glutamine--fructose-6-phosphate transaminase (isomerizing) [Firmicutes bacterium]|nr:glutamine--fructose-6-phosphate transaminase (isomerizing) [Bacillota bacterium]